jgi:hypothetical protein
MSKINELLRSDKLNNNSSHANLTKINKPETNDLSQVNPIEPVKLAKPVKPVKPVKPIKPIEPVKPVEPMKLVRPTKPVEPMKLVRPTKPVEPMKLVRPTKPVEPMKLVRPAKPIDLLKIDLSKIDLSKIDLKYFITKKTDQKFIIDNFKSLTDDDIINILKIILNKVSDNDILDLNNYFFQRVLISPSKQYYNILRNYIIQKENVSILKERIDKRIEELYPLLERDGVKKDKYKNVQKYIIKKIMPYVMSICDSNIVLTAVKPGNKILIDNVVGRLHKLYLIFENSDETYKTHYIGEIIKRLKFVYKRFGRVVLVNIKVEMLLSSDFEELGYVDKIKFFNKTCLKLISYFNRLIIFFDKYYAIIESVNESIRIKPDKIPISDDQLVDEVFKMMG